MLMLQNASTMSIQESFEMKEQGTRTMLWTVADRLFMGTFSMEKDAQLLIHKNKAGERSDWLTRVY
jgi:hypothetical protein